MTNLCCYNLPESTYLDETQRDSNINLRLNTWKAGCVYKLNKIFLFLFYFIYKNTSYAHNNYTFQCAEYCVMVSLETTCIS